MKPIWRIQTYLILLVMVIALPLTSLIAVTIYLDSQDDADQARESTHQIAKFVAAESESLIADAQIPLSNLAQRPRVQQMDPANCDPLLGEMIALQPKYANLVTINMAGQVICSAAPASGGLPFAGQNESFQQMIQSDRPVIAPPFVGPITGKWVSVLFYPIHNASGNLVGAMGLPLDLKQFQESLTPALIEGMSTTIVDANGNVIARSLDPESWIGQNARGKEIVDAVIAQKSGTAIARDADNQERVYGFETVPSANWHVYVGTLSEIAFANARASQQRNTDMVVLTVAIGILFAGIVSQRISHPITTLANAARAVAHGDLATRLPETGPFEIREVATEFNAMVAQNQHAQELVAARELQEAAMAELGIRALSGANLQKLFDDTAQMVASSLGIEFSGILEALAGKARLVLRAGSGFEEGLVGSAMIDARKSTEAEFAFRSNQPVVIKDLERETRFEGSALLRDHRVVSGIAVVIHGYQAPYGILSAYSSRKIEFSRDDVNFLQLVANVLATAIERKRAEQALQETQGFLQQVVDTSPSMIFVKDENDRVVFTNRAMADYYQTTPDQLMMKTTLAVHANAEEAKKFSSIDETVIQLQKAITVDEKSTSPSGELHWFHTVKVPLVRANGSIQLLGIATDITERKRAEQEREQYVQELQGLSQRLVEVEETERRHLAQELHDQVGQTLTALSLNLNLIKSQIPKRSAKVAMRLDDSLNLVEQTIQLVRNVMADLRPSVLDDYGLLAALEWYCKQFEQRTQVRVQLDGQEITPRLSLGTETVLFRIAQEALTNVAKHARAKQVTVSVQAENDSIQLIIADDGIGFVKPAQGGAAKQGLGLWTMRERALSIQGDVRIESELGKGTRVIAQVKR